MATTAPVAIVSTPSLRLARLRHELARLADARERAAAWDAWDAERAAIWAEWDAGGRRAVPPRAAGDGTAVARIDRELADVRRAIRAAVGERVAEVVR